MPTGNLPASGKKLWEEVYDKALKGSCKDNPNPQKCAAGSAWKAVKNAGWHKVNGKWTKKAVLVEFSLRIEKASFDKPSQERRWRAVTSDIEEDLHTDNMTLELYQDFLSRIESGEPVPEEYRSDFWSGGMPYLSISHYDDLDGKGVPGIVDVTYVDGKALKAKGRFSNTALGIRCFDALCDDLYNKNSDIGDKIRISIGFLDWQHRHKSSGYIFTRESIDDICPECLMELITGKGNGKAYLKGHLIHYALTRVPVNERTIMEVDKSMAITRKEDAASIIGEELAEELDDLQKAQKKSGALVTFSDVEDETETDEVLIEEAKHDEYECPDDMSEEDCKKEMEKHKSDHAEPVVEEAKNKKDKEMDIEDEEEDEDKKKERKSEILLALSEISTKLDALTPQTPVLEVHPLDGAIAELKKDFSDALAIEATPDEKLQLIQESYNRLGQSVINIVKSTVQETKPEPTNVVDNSQLTELANIVAGLAQKVDLLTTKLSEGVVLSGPKVPEPRQITPQPFLPFAQTQQPGKPLKLHEIVNRSVGLPG